MLLNYLKQNWGAELKIPVRHQMAITHDIRLLNLPVSADKETAMQIDDKHVLESIEDAVAIATDHLKLAPSLLFQTKCVNLIEDINSYKNVIFLKCF